MTGITFAAKDSLYHRVLRVAAVVGALVLLFESGIVSESTAQLSINTHQYLANAIGMSASIDPTELNSLTAELTAQKKSLDEREAAMREIEVNLARGSTSNDTATYILASILFVLLLLIVLNYALDYLRAREEKILPTAKTV